MSSFSCPHLNQVNNNCVRLNKDCIPGRPGCMLQNKAVFVVSAEKRINERKAEKEKFKTIASKKGKK
jgi:hypothetical protein